ncbi:MAG TPA: amino acid adenylation domain-containing protein, partial [Thermoanaerobaculia bacterium]|nr:amino acid adenylation domain-containing protein [Thermoanaerobaculia bacterium]
QLLKLPRRPGRSPLLTVTFNLDPAAPSLDLPGVETEVVRLPSGAAKFELGCNAAEGPSGLRVEWEYRTALFDAATIRRWLGHWRTLLAAVAADPARPVGDLPLLSPAEEDQILRDWNRTAVPYPRRSTIPDQLAARAAGTPGATALAFADGTWTYGELDAAAGRLAVELRARGIGLEDRVGLCVERSGRAVVAMLAILQAGGAYVPLDPEYPAERLAWMLEDAGVRVVVASPSTAGLFAALAVETLVPAGGNEGVEPPAATPARPDSLAYVIYTSGSTGRPKGVAVSHRAVLRLVLETDYCQLGPDDRVAQAASLSFDAATFEIWGPLLNGGAVIGVPADLALQPAELALHLRRHQVTTLFLTTALFNQVVQEAPEAFAGLRHLLFGGQRVDPGTVRAALIPGRAPERLLHVYGPTEVTTYATWQRVGEVADGADNVPIGNPLANTEAYVLDSRLAPVPAGVTGELYLGGDGLARGYLDRPALTAERFVPHPFAAEPGLRLYRTGDLVRRLPADGAIEFLGRNDGQVKVRGFRVEPGEVEAALARHPDLGACAVAARVSPSGDQRLVAYFIPRPGAGVDGGGLRRFLGESLPAHMIPAAFVALDRLPLTPNGKVDLRALPEPDETRSAAPPPTAAATPGERALARIWAEALARDAVGADENFFELGGDSILAIQIVARANDAGLRIRPRQLFQFPTVRELAALAETAEETGEETGEEADGPRHPVTGDLPPTPIQRWFYQQDPADPHHFNQAMLVEVREALDPQRLERALAAVLAHHDALRLAVRHDGSGWTQWIAPPDGKAD